MSIHKQGQRENSDSRPDPGRAERTTWQTGSQINDWLRSSTLPINPYPHRYLVLHIPICSVAVAAYASSAGKKHHKFDSSRENLKDVQMSSFGLSPVIYLT